MHRSVNVDDSAEINCSCVLADLSGLPSIITYILEVLIILAGNSNSGTLQLESFAEQDTVWKHVRALA